MVANHPIEDKRKLGFFIVENDIFSLGVAAKIGPHAFATYCYLVCRAGKSSKCFPKIDTACRDTGMSKPTIIKSINTLIKEGLISKKRTQHTNEYTVEDHLQSKRQALCKQAQSKGDLPPESTSLTPLLTITTLNEQDTVTKDRVLHVFNQWKQITNHPKSVLDKKREAKIKQAMKSYQDEDLIKAFRGCTKSPFHMGDNDRKLKYDDITLILRDSDHIERFIGFDDKPPPTPIKTFNSRDETRPRRPLS